MEKRVLFITPFVPNITEGAGAAYSGELINEVSKHHRVDLLYFRYSDKTSYLPVNANITIVGEFVISKLTKIIGAISLPHYFPLFTSRFSWKILRLINKLVSVNRYDIIYFDFSQTFSYARFIKHPNKVLMSHDIIAQKYSRMHKNLLFWAKWTESHLLNVGTERFTFSEKDCKLLSSLYNLNSVPTSFFIGSDVKAAIPIEIGDYYVMFGSWGRSENYEALDWVMDNIDILLGVGERIVVIGGGKMPEYIMKRIDKCASIEYKGFIENPYPIIANAKAELAPLYKGAGVKVKCVEALACGTPVIGTDVALEGIPEQFSKLMFRANSAIDFRQQMNYANNVSLTERSVYKSFFIQEYNYKSIVSYIDNSPSI